MKPLIFGLYTAGVLFVWIFFIIARMHSFKFKKFSKNVVPVTNLLLILLFCLTLLGYIAIYVGSDNFSSSSDSRIEIYY